MFKTLLFVVLIIVSSVTQALPKTKEKISEWVKDSHNYIVSNIGSNPSCQSLAGEYVRDLTKAHDLFLNDMYLPAIIKALDVTSLSARRSLSHNECRSRVATTIPHASLYYNYMLEQQNIPSSPLFSNPPKALNDGDKYTLIALTDVINEQMTRACRNSPCFGEEKAIIFENNVLQKELSKEQPDYELIAWWLSDIKGLAGTVYYSSEHHRELKYIHEKNTVMLSIIKPYIFQSQVFFGAFNRKLVDLVIDEAEPGSGCTQLLAQFLKVSIDTPRFTLNRLIDTNNLLYEILDEAIYTHRFYNSACTVSRNDLFNIPFLFTNQIIKQLYEIETKGSLELEVNPRNTISLLNPINES